ncbi:MAG: MMPL family transporter [Deltaproteobacteria bacterium]|nr:MAG: MMPL family transporter [Deltaproteobacteria bacterium]
MRDQTEKLFEFLGFWLYRNPIKALLSTFLLIGALVSQVPSVTIDTTSEALLHQDDPSLMEYNRFRDQFGRAELIIIAVESPEVFEQSFLNQLKSFHMELKNEVPYLKQITSLINVRHTHTKEDALIVEDLLGAWPEKPVNLLELKQQVLNNPFYLNLIISNDGRVAAVLIETVATVNESFSEEQILAEFGEDILENLRSSQSKLYFSEKENRKVVEAVNRVVNRYQSNRFHLIASGGPVIIDAFNRATLKDVRLFIVLSLSAVAMFLGLLFRRMSGVILPLLIINASLFSTLGIMALFGVPIKLPTTIIPAFLLVVGVCDAVHILAIFFRHYDLGETKEAAIGYAYGHSGLAIVFTSLTTIAGLLSFSLAELSAIVEIGYFAAAGVMLALIYTIIILPALISLTPLKRTQAKVQQHSVMDRVLQSVADFSARRPRPIIIFSLGIFVIFLPAVFQLKFSHNVVEYFPDHMPYRPDLNYIDQELKGSLTLEIVLDTGRENGIYEPWVLNRIELVGRKIEKINRADISVGKVISITDILKEIHQALNENDKTFYRIPQNRDVIAQEFLLFENNRADDLERIADSQFKKTRISVKTSWVDAVVCKDFMRDIHYQLQNVFKDKVEATITGLVALLARTVSVAIYSMAKSYLIAFMAITLMMILLMGDVKIGLLSMVPNLIPIIIAMGFMGFMHIPLDLNSLMIGSIALGIVVDDTVHFMYNFQKFYNRRCDPYYAVQKTLLGVGRALIITSLVLATGFFILMCSSLKNLLNFGFFTGLTVIIALLADFVMATALLIMINPRRAVIKIDANL